MLYMLFFASCIHSLKKCQLETKRKKLKKVSLTSMRTIFLIHMMFANNLFCLFRPCKQFFSIFFIPPLQKNNGPSLKVADNFSDERLFNKSCVIFCLLNLIELIKYNLSLSFFL